MMEMPKQNKDAKKARRVEASKKQTEASRELGWGPEGDEELLTVCREDVGCLLLFLRRRGFGWSLGG